MLQNVALNKRTWQSTTKEQYNSSMAVDDNIDTTSWTLYEIDPYWVVDLEQVYEIEQIIIINRNDKYGNLISFIFGIPNVRNSTTSEQNSESLLAYFEESSP